MSNRNLSIAGVAFVAFLVAGLLGLYDADLGVIVQGAALGVGTGLMAVGLVLIYRTTGVINFAYGAMGTVSGALAAGLTLGSVDLTWWIAAPLAIAVGALVGVGVEVLVIRRFQRSPRLVLTVATIGLAQALGGLALFIPGWFGSEALNPGFATPLSTTELKVHPVTLNGNHLLLAAVAPLALALLYGFLFRTESGTAVRGMAENLDRSRLLGIPVNRLNVMLWAIAGALAATTVVLKAPTQGLSVDAAAGPTLLLAPLAAAVVVGMRSIGGAFLVGIAIEIIDQLAQVNLSTRTWTYGVLLAIIVVGLLFQERSTIRRGSEESSWSTTGVNHRLPRRLAVLPEVRAARVVGALVVLGALVAIPFWGSPTQVNTATIALVYGMAALSLVVLTGWGGVVSLGQWALVGVGGLVTANLVAEARLDLFLTILLAAVAAGAVAAAVGIPALRVSGQLLAVTTLAFAVMMQIHVINPANYPDLVPGDYPRPELFGVVDLNSEPSLYALALVVLLAGVVVTANLRASRTGRVIAASRDNGRAAAAVGVDPTRTRIVAFVVSGMFAGVAGAIHAVALRGIGVNSYPASDSILLFSMAVIGGIASIGGTLGAVALVSWLGYAFPRWQLLITGVGLLVILMVMPGGLSQGYERLRDRLAQAAGRRRGVRLIDVVDEAPGAAGATEPETEGASTVPAPVAARDGSPPTPNAAPLLECHGVEAGYGALQVLFGIDTEVAEGDVLALLGTNGAGKSTLFKSIVGLLPATAGTIRFEGEDITKLPTEQIARRGLSMMPGGKGIFPSLTVRENLRLATWMLRGDRGRARARTDEMLTMFPVLRSRSDQPAGNLSGGEQQQLSIAMAFVTEPKVVLIDELSLGLAPTIVGMLVDRIRDLHARGTTVVVVEQSVNVALLMCRDAVFLEKGRVRFRGPTEGLLDRPDILRAVFIGGDEDEATAAEATAARPPRTTGTGPRFESAHLTKRFGGIVALDEVTIRVEPGAIVGLVGHNGAGKTTLFDVLTGFLPADGGHVRLGDTDVTDLPPHRRAHLRIGRSFQEARLFPSLTVRECILVSLERHLANRDPLAAALRLPASTDSEAAAGARADELLEQLGLDAYRDRPTGELSTGTRRIVELACLLAQEPSVVLLDEPTAGVAQAETERMAPMLRRVQRETGCSMVVIEHDMALLTELCDELVALEEGRVIARGEPAAVLADPAVVASYLGTDEDVIHRSGQREAPSGAAPA